MRTSTALALPLLALCTHCVAPEESKSPVQRGQLGQAFSASAHEANVAEPLLYAIAQIEDGLDEPLVRKAAPEAEAPQAGPLRLRHASFDSLGEAARVAGTTELALREDARLALSAGGKVLADLLARHGASMPEAANSADVDWAPVKEALAEWSGYVDRWHQVDYATRVLGVLARGGEVTNRFGEALQFDAMDVPPALLLPEPKPVELLAFVPDYPGAEPFPMPANAAAIGKYKVGRDGTEIDLLIIHDTEGGWEGSVATFQSQGKSSVHYLIGKDGRLAQFTYEADTAYHAGNRIYNRRAIGIEHVGYAHLEYPEAQYAKSAEVVGSLATKYAIPSDRSHIIGHDQVPSSIQPDYVAADGPPCMMAPSVCQDTWYYGGASGHTDPGIWQWGPYMDRLGGVAKCNDLPSVLTCDSTGNYAMACAPTAGSATPVIDVRKCATTCTSTPLAGDAGVTVDCAPITPPVEPPPPGPRDAGLPPAADAAVPPPPPVNPTGELDNDLNRYDEPVARGGSVSAEGGCSAAPGRDSAPLHGFALVAFVASMLGVSRARSGRRSPRISA